MLGKKRVDQFLTKDQLAFVKLLHLWIFLMALPDPEQITAPFTRRGLLESIFTCSQLDATGLQTHFQRLYIGGFPHLKADGIVGLIIAVR